MHDNVTIFFAFTIFPNVLFYYNNKFYDIRVRVRDKNEVKDKNENPSSILEVNPDFYVG